MSIAVNRVTLAGYLGRDPQITALRDGGRAAVLSLATTDHWTDRQSGAKHEHTEWHRVVVWLPHLVRLAEAYLKAGSAVYVEGRLESRVWSDREGRRRHVTEVVLRGRTGELRLLDRPPRRDAAGGTGHAPNGQARQTRRRVRDDPNAPLGYGPAHTGQGDG